ncbi:MAG: hypothetical protein ACREP6_14870 [Candidatus Binataceae bacterium]
MPEGRVLRWVLAAMAAILLCGAFMIAILALYLEPPQAALIVTRKIFETLGTIMIGGLYLWSDLREWRYPGGRDGAMLGIGAARIEATSSPRIIQNIYPPSASPAPPDLREIGPCGEIIGRLGELKTGIITAEQIILGSGDSKGRVAMGINPDGYPGLRIFDAEGHPRIVLAVRENGHAIIELNDARRNRRASLAVRADGFSELAMLDESGKVRGALGAAADDAFTYLGLRAGRTYSIVMEGTEISESLWDKDARLIWSNPLGARKNAGA